MAAYIHDIATAVPENCYEQTFLRDRMKEYVGQDRLSRRIIHRIYSNSGIRKRHSVIDDFNSEENNGFFFGKDGSFFSPSTGRRNELYSRHAKRLFVELAEKLLAQNNSLRRDEITHVITVSCTGFFAPGPAFEIVRQLGLSSSTERYHLGFMGCFGAFPALRMARSFCEENPEARVMVVCLELCSLHLQARNETDSLISASVFADGASGAIVSPDKPETGGYRIDHFYTAVADSSAEEMAWSIGDNGFDMVLSTYVPDIIETNIEEAIAPLLDKGAMEPEDIQKWGIHPGGRAILDKIETGLGLVPDQLTASREVLASYGNMSSATILFVLQRLSENPSSATEPTLAMAFGPGLTLERALLTKLTD